MSLSRRQLLQRSLAATALGLLPPALCAEERQALTIPPLLDIGRGRPLRLDFRALQQQFAPNQFSQVLGANGLYLTPTVRVRSGDFIKLTYLNNLAEPLSVQVQGLLTDSQTFGTIHRTLATKQSWSPIVPVQQAACSAWYYATQPEQLYRGLAGLWLIEDEQSKKSDLPHRYGVDDIPLILQDVQLAPTGQLAQPDWQKPFLGSTLLVNGKPHNFCQVQAGWIRLRIVNASLSRHYDLQLDNGQSLWHIATGMGMFAEPIERKSLSLAPSERAEILLDLNHGKTISLLTGEKRGILDKLGQLFADDSTLTDNVIIELRPNGLQSAFNQRPTLPEFNTNDFQLSIAKERKFHIQPNQKQINSRSFDPNLIDFNVALGSVERWYLTSDESVGFSLQGAKFILETRNRKRVALNQLAWQDTVRLEKNQEATILVRFDHPTSPSYPFSFGVTDAILRQNGAMGQFSVSSE